MKYHHRRQRYALNAQINLIPYIDVMLVLLIIFIITAPLMTQSIDLKLPQVAQSFRKNVALHPRVIYVDMKGRYYLLNPSDHDAKYVNLTTLLTKFNLSAIHVQKPNVAPTLIKADRHVHYDAVIQLIAALKQRGIVHIGLVTQQQSKRPR